MLRSNQDLQSKRELRIEYKWTDYVERDNFLNNLVYV